MIVIASQLLSKPKFSGVEKIKTIGSTYMAATGLSAVPSQEHAQVRTCGPHKGTREPQLPPQVIHGTKRSCNDHRLFCVHTQISVVEVFRENVRIPESSLNFLWWTEKEKSNQSAGCLGPDKYAKRRLLELFMWRWLTIG